MISSRNFGVKIDGNETNALVPFADMFNHASKHQSTWTFDQGRDGFTMTADEDIAENEEIFDSYGSKSNYRFFLHYAFLLQDNSANNEFPMTIDLDMKDTYYHVKKANFLDTDPLTQMDFKLV